MIKASSNYKYDYKRHEFVPTREYMINNLPYQESEIDERIENFDKWIVRYARRIYQHIYYSNMRSNKQFIHYKIAENIEGERTALFDAIVEYAMGALESERDLNQFHDLPDITKSTNEILKNGSLLGLGNYQGRLPDYGDY